MGISVNTRRTFNPLDYVRKGSMSFWLPPSSVPANGRAGLVKCFTRIQAGPSWLLAPVAEGSRVGQGTVLSDPYAYLNDDTVLVNYAPSATGGLAGKQALRFGPQTSVAPDVGPYVDDTNTGAATQAPDEPGNMLAVSTGMAGTDSGEVAAIRQPRTVLLIWKFIGGARGFNPMFEINGLLTTGGTVTEDGFFFSANGRMIKQQDAVGGANLTVLDANGGGLTGDSWHALVYRAEDAAPVYYDAVTGEQLAGQVLLQAGTYVPQSVNGIVGDRSHTLGGRRYDANASSADRDRQRNFTNCTVQEICAVDELVPASWIARYVRKQYPGIEQVVVNA